MLSNVQGFREALSGDRSKAASWNGPLVNDTTSGEFGRKLCKNFPANNWPKLLRVMYPQSFRQQNNPAGSKFHTAGRRIPKKCIEHGGEHANPEEEQPNNGAIRH